MDIECLKKKQTYKQECRVEICFFVSGIVISDVTYEEGGFIQREGTEGTIKKSQKLIIVNDGELRRLESLNGKK